MDEGEIRIIAERLKENLSQNMSTSREPLPTYDCEICRDELFISYKDEEGRLISKPCVCYARKQAEALLKKSGLADSVDRLTFDSFVTETPLQERMKSTAKEYLEELLVLRGNREKKKPWMYIGGNPGAGKTHICTAVCGELLKNNIPVRYMQWVTESKPLKYSIDNENFDDLISEYVNVPVLYIDDLFKQKYTPRPRFTDADIRIAFSILNNRYLMDKPTIISSEWDLLDHLMEADEGVFSRVYERAKRYIVMIQRDIGNNYRIQGPVPEKL